MAGERGPSGSRAGHGATLKDVAARAGVGTSTVARVVHGRGYVAADTRERIEAAIEEVGFRLNAVASGLKSAKTTTIGALLHETLPNPFFAEVARGIEHEANERGYNVLLYNARGSARRERAGVEAFLSQKVAAIVFTTPLDEDNVGLADAAGVAVVEVEKPLYRRGGSVLVDNYVGASAAVEHLVAFGHTKVGFVGEPLRERAADGGPVDRVVNERYSGYRDALVAHGLEADDSLLAVGDYPADAGWEKLRTGRDYADRLLERRPDVTAIFAGSDLLAAGVLQALYERRLRVPEEVSMIGFDDTFARHLTPPLSTVRQPMFEMGRRAAALATGLALGEEETGAEIWLATELVLRESTARPGGHRIPANSETRPKETR